MPDPYASLEALKTALAIEEEDDTRDAALGSALDAASRSIDQWAGRRFFLDDSASARVYRVRDRVTCTPDGPLLLVDDIGSEDGIEVRAGGLSSLELVEEFELSPDNAIGRGRPVTGLLRTSGAWSGGRGYRVEVTARWGWPAVPDPIRQATLIQAARLYKRKDSPEGVLGSAEWGTVRVSRVDPDVWALVRHYALPGFG